MLDLNFHLKLGLAAIARVMSDVCLMLFYTLNAMRAASIAFETSSAQKGGHFILRQYMWDFSGWSDLSAVK